ncbi:RidA family protein [Glycomyces scopariae]
MTDPYDRLEKLGIDLPTVSPPKGSYVPAKRIGNLAFIAGQVPLRDGRLLASGRVGVGGEVDPAQARRLSEHCLLAALAAVHSIASLRDVVEIARLVGYVASVPGFHGQPGVIDGASDLLVAVFGSRGRHARTTVGVPELPLNAPVEIELTVQIAD